MHNSVKLESIAKNNAGNATNSKYGSDTTVLIC